VMAAIRPAGNRSTELAFAGMLRSLRIRGWKTQASLVFGVPDFFFPQSRIAVFVDGCFWHGCPMCFQLPRQNRRFWATKIKRNRARDRAVGRRLRKEDIKVIRLWEHDIERRTSRLSRVLTILA
jgi:DNA mismatch endonuclease (patch repair protein)